MATAAEITDPHLWTYTRVPRAGTGVCDICHGAPRTGFSRCWSCAQTVGQVEHPVELVVPISLSELQGQLHHVLRSYKLESYPVVTKEQFQRQVSALLARFLSQHRDCIRNAAGEDWDCITIVPSSQGRPGPHPLETAIHRFAYLRDQYRPMLQSGSDTTDHNMASDAGYAVVGPVSEARVLLVDDTFTSGARAQSAASALRLAGATVVAMVPIGRVINPNFSEESGALLAAASQQPFSFEVCCLEAQ